MSIQLAAATVEANQSSNFTQALTEGKVRVNLRYRYEHVDQDNDLKSANAHTTRTRLGYQTGSFEGFSLFAEMEDIRDIFSEDFNSTTNGKTRFSTVPDPQQTELNQAYLQFSKSLDKFDVLFQHGRQRQKWDNDRFIGNVGWRQNEQTYDAKLIKLSAKKYSLDFMYSHHTKVHRIFGDDSGDNGNFDVSNDLFNIKFSPVKNISATGYYYL